MKSNKLIFIEAILRGRGKGFTFAEVLLDFLKFSQQSWKVSIILTLYFKKIRIVHKSYTNKADL